MTYFSKPTDYSFLSIVWGEIIYLFICCGALGTFCQRGRGGKKEVLCQVLGKSDVRSSLLNYFLQSCCLKKK